MTGNELLHVSVLGNLAVLRQGARMPLPPSKKTRALLAYLAVTARPHSRDRLCAMFWPIPDDPRAALRWSLSRLRPLLDEHGCRRIIADRETVGLDLNRVAVDILSLRNAYQNGIDSISTDALRQAAQALEGDFLEGLDLPDCQDFQSWCMAESEETRRLHVRLLTALTARLDDVPEEALRYARTLSLVAPASEAAQATLVRLLRAAGRWREAENHFQSAQGRLEEFNTVQTGALRKAAQLPLQADARERPHNREATLPHAERMHALPALHEVKFCRTSDDIRIAYAVVGDGPPLVWAAHWLSHIAFSWESPVWRHWTDEFGKDYSFVHYDERGNGLSDWDVPEFSVDAFVRDLEAVVDTLGLERFALMGSSKGGPTAAAYAARHPKRVSHLILYGTFARGWRKLKDAAGIELVEAMITLIRQGWAQNNPAVRQVMTSLFLPDATLEEMGWFNELQRISSSAENAARLLSSIGEFDVLDLLPGITAPTLVLHCRGDAATPFEQGRLIASHIPGARFVALESGNHVLLPRDPAWPSFVSEVHRFLQEGRQTPSRSHPKDSHQSATNSMDDAECVSALVGAIYDASLEPELWPSVLSKAAEYTPGISAALFAKDVHNKNFEVHYDSGGIDPHYVQLYKDKYSQFDPSTTMHYFAEVGKLTSMIDLAPYHEFIETRFFKEWARPQGLVDFIGAAIDKVGTSVAMFGVFRHERHGLADDGARRRIHLIAPHIRRAVTIGRALDLKSSQAQTLLTVFDSMSACLFLIDSACRIVHANAAGYAMLAAENVLRAVSGRIEPYEAKTAQDFREMFDAAGKGDAALGVRGIAFPIPARDGEKYVAHLLPLTSGARGRTGSSFGAAAILLVQKASPATPAIPEVVAKTYGLTSTELRVLLAIAEVGGVSEVAEAFGVSETTIKFHLKNLFDKTGARRQADLVRLLAGFTTPLTR